MSKTLLTNFSRDYWHSDKNISNNFTLSFPRLINSGSSTVNTTVSELITKNCTLNDFGHIPPSQASSDFTTSVFKMINNDFFALFGLKLSKTYRLNGVPSIFLKICASVLTLPGKTFLFLPVKFGLTFESMVMCSLCLRRVTALTLETIIL